MRPITLFEVLGVSREASPEQTAAAFWPSHLLQGSIGARREIDTDEASAIMQALDLALTFSEVRPGTSAEHVGIRANVFVNDVPLDFPLVFTALPNFGFHLLATGSVPARVALTAGDMGVEFIIEALPVEIKLPRGLLLPLTPEGDETPPAEELQDDSFVAGQHDTLKVILRSLEESSIFVHIKVRITEDGRTVVEASVPLSIGPCRFNGLPCQGVHDLQLFPSPLMGTGAQDEEHYGELPLEWVRHPLIDAGKDYGVVTVRSLDLDVAHAPLSQLQNAVTTGTPPAQTGDTTDQPDDSEPRRGFEWVLEDLAFPIGGAFPIPSHFLAGLRREILPGDDPDGAYNLDGLTIPFKGVARILQFNYLIIDQLLFRSIPVAELDPDGGERQSVFVSLALQKDRGKKGTIAATIDVTDDWTIAAGIQKTPPVNVFKLFGAQCSILGVRLGLSIQGLIDDKNVYEAGFLLGDVSIQLLGKDKSNSDSDGDTDDSTTEGSSKGVVNLTSESNESTGIVIHDLGLRFGKFHVGAFWESGGAKLSAFDIIKLEITEFGVVTEPSGALYISLSGSIPLPSRRNTSKQVSTASATGEAGSIKPGVGVEFYRLRTKMAGADEAPQWLIDGIGVSLRYDNISISGFGTMSESVRDDHRFKEAGVSVEVRFPIGKTELLIGGLFFYGSVRGPEQNFNYWMAGLRVSPIPIGSIVLTDVRILFALNMTPKLGPLDPDTMGAMRLFEWYIANRNAAVLPKTRNLGVNGWEPLKESYTLVVAANMEVGSRALSFDAFLAYLNLPNGHGLLAGIEIFLFKEKGKSTKPIGFAVFEIDGERWSVSAGLAIGIDNVLGFSLPVFEDTPSLSGSFFHTNKPGTTAIGQFSDTSTWLALHIDGKLFDLFSFEVFLGLCLQIVDLPQGPRVFATRASISGGTRLFDVGGIDFYLTLQISAGVWRTESRVSGFIAFLEGGIQIDVFYVFNFGASARVQLDYLGPDPAYRRFFTEMRIHTPWWLPDASFRWSWQRSEAAAERMSVLTTPVVDASAMPLAQQEPVVLSALSPVVGNDIDAEELFSIDQLANAIGTIPADKLAGIETVAVDSGLALHFNVSVDDRLVFGQNTPAGVGADGSNDLTTRSELVEFGIRRRSLRNDTGWSFLINPEHSTQESLIGLSDDEIRLRVLQIVRLRWDADFLREGKSDPRRLLLNTDTPYSFAVTNLEVDEALVQNQSGWPCCPGDRPQPQQHVIHFRNTAAGQRVPRTQLFSDSNSFLYWDVTLPPVAATSSINPNLLSVARVASDTTRKGVFARLQFIELAFQFTLRVSWRPLHVNRELRIRTFRGMTLVDEQQFDLSRESPEAIQFMSTDGLTDVHFYLDGEPIDNALERFRWLEWESLRYLSLEAKQQHELEEIRCDAQDDETTRPGGRLAWLPQHEYELQWITRTTVSHAAMGTLVRDIPQTLRFHTKGLPGLNASERIGSEFEPYVDSVYPAAGRFLYREEPVCLALNEQSDIFQTAIPPITNASREQRQQINWALIVSQIGGAGDLRRISQPDEDWILTHRGTVAPAPDPIAVPGDRPINSKFVARAIERTAFSLNPQWQRFEAVLASPDSCGIEPRQQPSRVLLHEPHDPALPERDPPLWPADALLRASVQISAGSISQSAPYVDRNEFESGDETSLKSTDNRLWQIRDGALAPSATTPDQDQFVLAPFGNSDWRNVHIRMQFDPKTGEAGIALAVGGTPLASNALVFSVDSVSQTMRIHSRLSGVMTLLDSSAISASLRAPFTLELTAYDDRWQFQVGETTLNLDRAPNQQGMLALAIRGDGQILTLSVNPIDVYQLEFRSSRYRDFIEHIDSWRKHVDVLPDVIEPSANISELLNRTPVGTLMSKGADIARRQQAFNNWSDELGLVFRTSLERLEISQRKTLDGAAFLLLESPEPILFSHEVRLTINLLDSSSILPVRTLVLSDASEHRAIVLAIQVVPGISGFITGTYQLDLQLSRSRYRAASTDINRDYEQLASVIITL